MKKAIYLLLFLISIHLNLFSIEKFNPTPLNINFTSIESKGDTVVALGDNGYIELSNDLGNNWEQIRIFNKGIVLKLFLNDTSYLAFSNLGEISKSSDFGKSWQIYNNIEDSIIAVLRIPDGYLIRSPSKLILLDFNFIIKNTNPLNSKSIGNYLTPLNNVYYYLYTKSIIYYQNSLFVAIPKSNILKFDMNLNFKDTINFGKEVGDSKTPGLMQLEKDSNNLYYQLGMIYKTNNFKDYNIVFNKNGVHYKMINNKVYYFQFYNSDPYYGSMTFYLNQINDANQIDTILKFNNYNYYTNGNAISDFTIIKNKVFLVGINKFIGIIDILDGNIKVISDHTNFNNFSEPDIVNDSLMICYQKNSYLGDYNNIFYKSTDLGKTFHPIYKLGNLHKLWQYYIPHFKYFDEISKKSYLVISSVSTDSMARSFIIDSSEKNLQYKGFDKNNAEYTYSGYGYTDGNFIRYPNGNSIITGNVQDPFDIKKMKNFFYTYDSSYKQIAFHIDSGFVVYYSFSSDSNSYFVYCRDFFTNNYKFIYSNNKGINWKEIKNYGTNVSINSIKQYLVNGKNMLFLSLNQNNDSNRTYYLEAIDLDNRVIQSVYSKTDADFDIRNYSGFDVYNNTLYFTFRDTLFMAKDLGNYYSWKYWILPNNGYVNQAMRVYKNNIFARFSSDIYEDNMYNLNLLQMNSTPLDVQAEVMTYFYNDKPYPLPSKNEVNIHLYWENKLDLLSKNIEIYNIFGEKVSQEGDIHISKYSNSDGVLTWDCENQMSGTYLLNVKYGDVNKSILFIINR